MDGWILHIYRYTQKHYIKHCLNTGTINMTIEKRSTIILIKDLNFISDNGYSNNPGFTDQKVRGSRPSTSEQGP